MWNRLWAWIRGVSPDDGERWWLEVQVMGGRTLKFEVVGTRAARVQLEKVKEEMQVWEVNRLGWQVPHTITAIRLREDD